MTTATASDHLTVGTILGGTYRIVRQMAVGGMGELYEATHLRLSGRYAVKVLLPQFAAYEEVIARFQREAEITSGLRHPNIVSVLDFNTTPDGRAFLAMEYLEGHDLASEIQQAGQMPLERVIDITGQVVSALSAAHAHGVVHRDLKPPNIFVSPLAGDGRDILKVLDFGISKMREAHTKLTREHSIMGTPQYMAPEQALGKMEEIDHRTDQFSLAAIAYEMLAGREAFRGDSVPAILYQVVHETPQPLARFRPDVSAAVEQVLLRALSKDSEARFPTIGQFGQALLAAAQGRTLPRDSSLATARTELRLGPGPGYGPGSGAGPGRTRPGTRPPTMHRRNTTLGMSSAELRHDELVRTLRRPRRGWQLGAVVCLGGAALGVATWFSWRDQNRDQPPAATASRITHRVLPPAPPPPGNPPPVGNDEAPSVATTPAAPVPSTPTAATTGVAVLPPAPVYLRNPPPGLRVTVDEVQAELPLRLPIKQAKYKLRFQSPGRRPQTVEVDGLMPSHDIRLEMPRVAREPEPEIAEEDTEISAPEEIAPPPAQLPPPAPAPTVPAKPRPSLIEDVDDAPTPKPEKPRVPLIDDL